MTTFGLAWVIILCIIPLVLAIVIAKAAGNDVEAGIMFLFIGGLCSLLLGGLTLGTSEPRFSGGYKVPNYKRYYMATDKNGAVDITKVVTYYKCSHGHLHTDVDYVFYSKATNGGVVRWTAEEDLKIEYYDGKPLIEMVESYYYTGKMDWWSHLFWKEEESRTSTRGCPKVVRLYVPKGTKIKTIQNNNGKRSSNK